MSETHDCCPSCRKGSPCEQSCSRSLIGQITAGLPACTDTPAIEAWKKANRASLFPGQWNGWTVYRTLTDNPSVDELTTMSKAVFDLWFNALKESATGGGSADNIEVVPLFDPASPANAEGNWYDPAIEQKELATTPALRARRDDLPVPPLITPGPWAKVLVRFVYRGAKTDMAWPVHKASAIPFVFDAWCPSDADYMVDKVFGPDTKRKVPKEETWSDKVKAAGASIEKAAIILAIGLGIVVIVTRKD